MDFRQKYRHPTADLGIQIMKNVTTIYLRQKAVEKILLKRRRNRYYNNNKIIIITTTILIIINIFNGLQTKIYTP